MSGEPPKNKNSRAEFQSAIARLKEAAGKRRAMDRHGSFGPPPTEKAAADAEISAAIACVRGFPPPVVFAELHNAEYALRESQKEFMFMDTLMRTPSDEADALERAHRKFRTKLETDEAFVAAMERVLNRSGRTSHFVY